MAAFRAFGSSEKGPVRHTNEDCFGLDDPAGSASSPTAWAGTTAARSPRSWPSKPSPTSSGVGGESRLAVRLRRVAVGAGQSSPDRDLHRQPADLDTAAKRRDLSGMGTTIVAALVHAVRWRLPMSATAGSMCSPAAPLRQLTATTRGRSIGTCSPTWSDPGPRSTCTWPRSRITDRRARLLLTDGVHGVDRRPDAAGPGRRQRSSAGDRHRLVQAALTRGSRDNCTAVVGQYGA